MAPNDRMEVAEVEKSVAYAPDKVNTFVVDEFDDFKENPVLFYATTWTVGSLNVVVTTDLFASYVGLASSSLSFMSKKLSNFMFLQGDLRVTIAVQGNSVAQGKMVLSFDPCVITHNQISSGFNVPVAQATRGMLLPHIEIDPSATKTYTIDLPAPTPWGLYSLYVGAYNSGLSIGSYRMKQHIINPLGSGTAVVPAVEISVYLSTVKPKLVGATASAGFTLTSALKTEKTDGSGGVISGYFKKAASIASVVSAIPVPAISEAATLFGGMAGATASFLSWFGYSKPVDQTICHSSITTHVNMTKIDNNLASEMLSFRSNNSVGLSGASCPLYDPKHSIVSELASKPGLVRVITVPFATAANTLITSFVVSPTINRILDDPAVANGFEQTPLSYVAYPYRRWRGDIIYDIEFVCSVFHRCTIVVMYDPGCEVLTGAINRYMSVLQHWTIQVSGSSTTRIVIPWKSLESHKLTERPTASTSAPSGLPTPTANGALYFCLLNSITTNGSTDPVFINVYESGENMRFGGAVTRNCTPVFTSAIKANDDTGFFRQFFGEEHAHTVKELASRQSLLFNIRIPAAAVARQQDVISIPNGHLIPGNFDPLNNTVGTWNGAGFCLVDYLSLAFVGTRGSYDYTIYPNGGHDTPHSATLVYGDAGILAMSAFVATNVEMFSNAWVGLSSIFSRINNSITVTAPFYYNGMFRPTFQTGRGITDGIIIEAAYPPGSTGTVIASCISVLKSGGDDFMFVGFRGCPTTVYAL